MTRTEQELVDRIKQLKNVIETAKEVKIMTENLQKIAEERRITENFESAWVYLFANLEIRIKSNREELSKVRGD